MLNKIKNMLLRHKNKVSVILILFIAIGVAVAVQGYYKYKMTPEDKVKKIEDVLAKKDYNKARNLTEKYLSGDEEEDYYEASLKEYCTKLINECEDHSVGSKEELNKYKSQEYAKEQAVKKVKQEEQQGKLEIIKIEAKQQNYSSKFCNVEITVQNKTNKPINYVKLNIFYFDENKNIVSSDWTNDSSKILPNAQQKITKMAEMDGWKSVGAEIEYYK
ncbi:UNVERIFIED_ORG: hypothetical protein B2H98_12515 [Clostridium botulinum]|uniref:DUF4352 domain-containing protein n=1 Tax=Clostridium botulinum TaxID=1491 RepID=A0A6M0SVE9_CLOBO|nr:hypothetical protein [Clostridium botulinum]MBY6809332.1 hypothetical protein [Clostridium botulinum]MBY6822774.1 hypothetical protein [Clostridium botulinum]MBY6833386.1 hypothetical protein [Clostridium botulinum]MBY6971447.1 hypothetical protein [Clostridium botulinum]NFA43725.1 hypothetical protein [Clostridium botulinum]